MEFVLLAKVGMVIGGLVNAGYVFAGGILVKTAFKYRRDYKESVANERMN